MEVYTLDDLQKSLSILDDKIKLIKTEINVASKSFIKDSKAFAECIVFLNPLLKLLNKTAHSNSYGMNDQSNDDLNYLYKRTAQRSLALARIQETIEQMDMVVYQLKKAKK